MKANSSEEGWRLLLKLCSQARTEKELNELLGLLLSLEEKEDLATRCLIVKELLNEEKPQRKIAAELGVSIAKITRGSNALKIISKELREFLNTQLD
jgi:TrpR family trp operon transcriptional repressor